MEMGDAFAGVGAVIDDEAVAGFVEAFFLGDVAGGEEEIAEDRGIVVAGGADAGDDALRDHENVHGGLRVDVANGEDVRVIADDFGGDFPGGDAFEEGHDSSSSSPRLRRRRAA